MKGSRFTDKEWAFHIIHSKEAQSQGQCTICNAYGWNYTK